MEPSRALISTRWRAGKCSAVNPESYSETGESKQDRRMSATGQESLATDDGCR